VREGATSESEIYDIVVCQVNHKIVCEPWVKKKNAKGQLTKQSPCKTEKTVKPVAKCLGFDASVWSTGATCIANHVNAVAVARRTPTKPADRIRGDQGEDMKEETYDNNLSVEKKSGRSLLARGRATQNSRPGVQNTHRLPLKAQHEYVKVVRRRRTAKVGSKPLRGCENVNSHAVKRLKQIVLDNKCVPTTNADKDVCTTLASALGEYY